MMNLTHQAVNLCHHIDFLFAYCDPLTTSPFAILFQRNSFSTFKQRVISKITHGIKWIQVKYRTILAHHLSITYTLAAYAYSAFHISFEWCFAMNVMLFTELIYFVHRNFRSTCIYNFIIMLFVSSIRLGFCESKLTPQNCHSRMFLAGIQDERATIDTR